MNIIDAIIVLFLLLGAVIGFKRGVIKSVVSFVGTVLVFVLSFILKDTIATILYSYLPFFNIGIPAFNILIYEGIAFVIIFVLLSVVLKIVVKLSGMIELLLKFTIILAIPSKILGAIFGFVEHYVFAFIVLFLLAQFNVQNSMITDSHLADKILSNTPFISNILGDTYNALKEIVEINKEYDVAQDKTSINEQAINILLKYNVVSEDKINDLIKKGKLGENNG